jgi:flagellar hook-length control protein FliK
MSLNMSTNTAATAAGRALAALTAAPAPAAHSSAPAAAQPQTKATPQPAAGQSGGGKPANAAGGRPAARPAAQSAGQGPQAQRAANDAAAGNKPIADAARDARAANAARPAAPAIPPNFAQLLDLAALAPSAASAQADVKPTEPADQQAASDSADATADLSVLLPSFAVLPLPTGTGAQQGDGSGQQATPDNAAADIKVQPAATPDSALFALTTATNAAGLQAAQASAAANNRGPQADDAQQAAANALTAVADALSAQAGQAGAARSTATDRLQASTTQADAGADAFLKASAKAGSDTPQTVTGNDTHAFRGVMAGTAATPPAGDTIKLSGNPEQWQQPLRSALGDRLQLQMQRNSEQAVIRLDPPNLGSIEISIRHSAGALQVNLSASNSEVLRQLNNIGDSMRQDLSQRQFSEVAVNVSSSAGRNLADGSGGGRHERQQQERGPGRALDEGNEASTTFAMLSERE